MKTLSVLFICILTLSISASSDTKSDSKPLVLPDFSNLNINNDSKVKYSSTCKFPNGREVDSSSIDYQSCIQMAHASSLNSGQQNSNQTGTQQSINFKIGK